MAVPHSGLGASARFPALNRAPTANTEVIVPAVQPELLRVVVVDDSPEFVNSALRRLAFDLAVEVVGCASSGKEALELVRALVPDLVLMDLAMPEMNGLEATRRIKALPAPPRVLILTLYDDPAYRVAAAEAGADGFVTKAEWNEQMPTALRGLFGARWARVPRAVPVTRAHQARRV